MSKGHSLVGWDRAWKGFCTVLNELHGKYPEWLGLTRYLVGVVGTNHPQKAKPMVAGERIPRVRDVAAESGGILFIPIYSRDYCLGVCYRLAEEVRKSDPTANVHMLMPEGRIPDKILDDKQIYWHPKSDFRKMHFRPKVWVRGALAATLAIYLLASNQTTRKALKKTFKLWPVHILKHAMLFYWEIGAAEHCLKKWRVHTVATINDVVKPASGAIAAARLSGLRSIVMQHGAPGPQSSPFIAEEAWVWGDSSKQILKSFGADPNRLNAIGNFETERVQYQQRGQSNGKVLLLLSQWRASTGWGEPEFQRFFHEAAEAVARLKDPSWRILIRLHPNEGDDVRDAITALIEGLGVPFGFCKEENTIEQDIMASDFLCTVNSSSIMHGIAADLPCAALLSTELEKRVGPSLLPPNCVARNRDELLSLLRASKASSQSEKEWVLANCGSVFGVAAKSLLTEPHSEAPIE
ncbi:hypothetical protein HW115_06085 [Verrucomicrobiaceae bacterium N1E253]|uniref:Capsule polysaccharide biosynthesis protein n=1 Tax=Oceaniferula marina TaxID=2748318 RepID=A0A851GH46_9BACT|nr:hypothetical protein [Oceaniferula marina]NWK55171.1 hypothetical protein [Oceaniferula marina]